MAAPVALPWIVTVSGRKVSLSAPGPGQIVIGDIAVHLSRLPRYLGATRGAYSVAQHSCLVAEIVRCTWPGEAGLALLGLMRDAHEAYIGDIVTPVGWALGIEGDGGLAALKARMDLAIGAALGLPVATVEQARRLHLADQMAFRAEWRELMPGRCPARTAAPGWARRITALPAETAARVFLARFAALTAALRSQGSGNQVSGVGSQGSGVGDQGSGTAEGHP
jgi:hypothetical protein